MTPTGSVMPVVRALLSALLTLAVCLPIHAQERAMPDTLPRLDVARRSLAEGRLPAPPAPETYSLEAGPGSPGSLLAETITAAATTLAVGTLSVAWVLHEDAPSFDVLAVLPPFLLAAPLLSSLATTLAGAATGGDGSWLYSFAASAGAAGVASCVAVIVMGFAMLSIYGFQEFHDEEESAELRRDAHAVAIIMGGLIMGTTVTGAVIGYRASARRARNRYAVNAMPTLDGRGAMFSIGGAL